MPILFNLLAYITRVILIYLPGTVLVSTIDVKSVFLEDVVRARPKQIFESRATVLCGGLNKYTTSY